MSGEEIVETDLVSADGAMSLVKVTQLPVIEDQLRVLRVKIERLVSDVDSMVCDEETLQTVKSRRADLNKLFAELEERRKAVLAEVGAPIERFKATYKECVSEYFKTADAKLRDKVSTTENGMKAACEDRLREFFDELTQSHHIDFLRFEQAGIVVSLTDARAKTQPPKKLREQLEQFVLRVVQDVEMIATLEDADEVMSVYKQTLNATQAIATVNERHRQIERARAEQEARAAAKVQETETVRKVQAFAAPVTSSEPAPAPMQEEKLSCTFTVNDTKERLILLKRFLDANGYQYT